MAVLLPPLKVSEEDLGAEWLRTGGPRARCIKVSQCCAEVPQKSGFVGVEVWEGYPPTVLQA